MECNVIDKRFSVCEGEYNPCLSCVLRSCLPRFPGPPLGVWWGVSGPVLVVGFIL